jgi:hypothetical protein
MPLRSSRFYLFGYLHYYGHIRLPQQQRVFSVLLGSPTFMRYLLSARNCILPRIFLVVPVVVNPNKVAGFSSTDRLANTNCVTRLHYSSLQKRIALNFVRLVSAPHIRATSTRTTNLVARLFHPLGI